MSLLLKKLVLATALLVMPLQGIAATLSVLLCHGDVQAHVIHANDAADGAMHGDGQPDDGGTGGNAAFHPCCHNVFSAATLGATLAARPEFPVRAFAPDAVHALFFPELPQRPPLA